MLGLFCANTIVIAAVSVVFPWSTCPIVPTFTCGFVRSNFCFAISASSNRTEDCLTGLSGLAHGRAACHATHIARVRGPQSSALSPVIQFACAHELRESP